MEIEERNVGNSAEDEDCNDESNNPVQWKRSEKDIYNPTNDDLKQWCRYEKFDKSCQTEWDWEEDLKIALSDDVQEMVEASDEEEEEEEKEEEEEELPNEQPEITLDDTALISTRSEESFLCTPISDLLIRHWDSEENLEEERNEQDVIKTLPNVGPPQILQYLKESTLQESNVFFFQEPSDNLCDVDSLDDGLREYILQLDSIVRKSLFENAGTDFCPFCKKSIVRNQICCNAFRNFKRLAKSSEAEKSLKENSKEASGKENIDGKTGKGRDSMGKSNSAMSSKGAGKDSKQNEKKTKAHSQRQNQTSSSAHPKLGNSKTKDRTGLPGGRRMGARTAVEGHQSRQPNVISYALSSDKCMNDGWTLFPSKAAFRRRRSKVENQSEFYQNVVPTNQEGRFIVKRYDDGNIFTAIFPDGSGSVFHPNGRIAISIVHVSRGMYTYIVQNDSEDSRILAVFQPTGHASTYYQNGQIRLSLDDKGGMELNPTGAKKRKWLWSEISDASLSSTVYPIIFGVTSQCGFRLISQNSMFLTYSSNCKSCRFNVGVPKNAVLPSVGVSHGDDTVELYRRETRMKIDYLMTKLSDQLEFPHSKLNNIAAPKRFLGHRQKTLPAILART